MEASLNKRANIAVIGSGLSALGAIKALVAKGIIPRVIDVGETIDQRLKAEAAKLAALHPGQWTPAARDWLNVNDTVNAKGGIPKKLVFGSDYFYGKSRHEAPVSTSGNIPPFSYALGGLSAGWGAAILPPQSCDIADWPLSAEELWEYCKVVLQGIPYSAQADGLSLDFDLLSDKANPVKLGRAGLTFQQWLLKRQRLLKGRLLFGQARLLVDAGDGSGKQGCRYCGQCSSGCVYNAIFKAGDEILRLHQQGKIDYMQGYLVDRIEEPEAGVRLHAIHAGKPVSLDFDRIYLACGAVNSTRIVMQSLQAYHRKLPLKTRGGFVIPVLSLRAIPRDWPECNTQTEFFVEFRQAGQHWVHAQIALENELLAKKLGISPQGSRIINAIKRFVGRRLFVVLVNYHSDHSGVYELSLEPESDSAGCRLNSRLNSTHKTSLPQAGVLFSTLLTLSRFLLNMACIPLLPFAKLNSGSYHVGGTLPMSKQPQQWNETDLLGRPGQFSRLHVVDTAVFPSLPGTTIGLLAMANAYRIVEQSQAAE